MGYQRQRQEIDNLKIFLIKKAGKADTVFPAFFIDTPLSCDIEKYFF
jgi:hypothetical protein